MRQTIGRYVMGRSHSRAGPPIHQAMRRKPSPLEDQVGIWFHARSPSQRMNILREFLIIYFLLFSFLSCKRGPYGSCQIYFSGFNSIQRVLECSRRLSKTLCLLSRGGLICSIFLSFTLPNEAFIFQFCLVRSI